MALPDVLNKDLDIVFCGTAAGNKSARLRQYYAGPGNKFYPILHRIGLTSQLLTPDQFTLLPKYGIGLTDIVKKASGNDNVLKSSDYDVPGFLKKIFTYKPRLVCFNGKKAASVFYDLSTTKKVSYGLQAGAIGETHLFVAPSTSGAANKYWDHKIWADLPQIIDKLKK